MGFTIGAIVGWFVGAIMMFLFCYSAFTDDYVEEEKEVWTKY
jgi:hypothetical protein